MEDGNERPPRQRLSCAELGRSGDRPPHKSSRAGLPPCTGLRCGPVQGLTVTPQM